MLSKNLLIAADQTAVKGTATTGSPVSSPVSPSMESEEQRCFMSEKDAVISSKTDLTVALA